MAAGFGKDGEDVVVTVPCGTVVFDADTGEYLCEVTDDGQEVKLLRGGRGGLGNWHFKSATNRTPRYAQPGEPAIEKSVVLELKPARRCGSCGFPECRKIDIAVGVVGSASENRRLSVHHDGAAGSESWVIAAAGRL